MTELETRGADEQLEVLIARRERDRRNGRGGFPPTPPTEEQLWAASERRVAEQLRRAARWAWVRHHEDLAVMFTRIAAEHSDKAAALIAELEGLADAERAS